VTKRRMAERNGTLWSDGFEASRGGLAQFVAARVLHIPHEEILFVSSNSWDAAGATAFGYKVCWCNSSQGNMEELGISVDLTVLSLDQIASGLTQGSPRLANKIP
jgi:hypothetical protein